MNGKQHRQIAPIFTLGASFFATSQGLLQTQNQYVTVGVATAVSILFANALDADLYATYPIKVLMSPNNSRHIVRVKDKNGKWVQKTYSPPKGIINKTFAIFFKMLGVRKHRDWRSHSPIIYFPLGLLLLKLFSKIPDNTGIITGVIAGIVLGIWSHILADMPNKGGIQLFPKSNAVGVSNILPNFMANWFKSGSKFMYMIIIASLIEMYLFIVSKDTAIRINSSIYNFIKTIILFIWNFISNIFLKSIGK